MILLPGRSSSWSAGSFDPVDMFSSGEAGCLLIPSLSTCYTDQSGTTSVTADGDACQYIDDTSGNGNDAATSGASSLALTFKTSGGINWLQGAAGDFVGFSSNPLSGASAGYMILSQSYPGGLPPSSANESISDFGANTSQTHLPFSDGNIYATFGSSARINFGAGINAQGTATHNVEFFNDGSNLSCYVNGSQIGSNTAITLSWTGVPKLFKQEGEFYGLLAIDRIPTGSELTNVRNYFLGLGP